MFPYTPGIVQILQAFLYMTISGRLAQYSIRSLASLPVH